MSSDYNCGQTSLGINAVARQNDTFSLPSVNALKSMHSVSVAWERRGQQREFLSKRFFWRGRTRVNLARRVFSPNSPKSPKMFCPELYISPAAIFLKS